MRRAGSVALVGAALAMVAASAGCRGGDAAGGGLLVEPLIARSPDGGVADAALPLDGESLKVVLPRLKRRSRYHWIEHNTLVRGHFAAHLATRDDDHTVLIVTVDDLVRKPERARRLAASSERIGELPAEVARGAWIRVLVAERFELALRADDESFYDHKTLQHWYEELEVDDLQELLERGE